MAQFDLIVIGSGPGGYVAAIRAAQLGLNTALVERDAVLGGTCLHRGCIPAKTWLETAHRLEQMQDADTYGIDGVDGKNLKANLAAIVKRKGRIVLKNAKGIEFLMKKNKVTVLKGFGKLLGGGKVDVNGEVHEAKRIILATGSAPKPIPGLETDGKQVLNSDHILDITELPSHLVILGAGAIGVEFASVFSRLGSKVTLVEFMDTLLPLEDEDIGQELAKIFKKSYKIDVRTKTKITRIEKREDGVLCHLEGEAPGEVLGSHLLVAVGRAPQVEGIGLEKTKAQVDRGCVVIDKFMQTGEPGLYAIGDIVRTPWLAHVASDEGIVAAEHIAQSLGKDVHPHPIRYDRFPACTYCDPEVGSIGLSEKAAKAKGHDVQVGSFPFSPMAKANIVGEPHGFIKIVADKQYGEILGIHILGPKATELVASSVALMGGEYTVDELIQTMYPHPTLNEVFPEAARAVYGRALNM
ncbi:MAG: dihydrolipoyl dehydrogenase [Acidobacteria bacterium]|nr:dihydrolipoyl dehydrogenase [Acidobacteriota bacterium]MBI3489098.1 dihydrolipoyl dehydrogenase [Acidobacteriota bacterium]